MTGFPETGFPETGFPVTSQSGALTFAANDDEYLRELAEFVAIPSVSRDATPQTMLAAAHWLAAQLPFAVGRVEQTAGHPVARADWAGPPGASWVARSNERGHVIALAGGGAPDGSVSCSRQLAK